MKIMVRDAIDADTEASIRNEVSMLQSLVGVNPLNIYYNVY
jgi:hypothetical protein